MSILLAVASLALVVFGICVLASTRAVLLHNKEPSGDVVDWSNIREGISQQTSRIDALETDLERQKLALSEGIERVARSENRIQKTVTSARRLVRDAGLEHAAIDAEHAELQPPDADGGQPLPTMPAQMAATRTLRVPGGQLEIGAA